MDGTLFVARAQEQFSGGYTIYFWVRSAPILAPTSHPLRTHLPSIPHAYLHERYAFSAAHVQYGRTKVSWAVRYSHSSRTLTGVFQGYRGEAMHYLGYELPRIPILGSRVNK